MHVKTVIRNTCYLTLLVANISCDQISKHVVRESLKSEEQISIIPERLIITNIENSGAFLSLGSSLSFTTKLIVLIFFPLLILTLVSGILFTKKNLTHSSAIALCFIVGGGIGNLYDRVIRGSVTDFLHIDLFIVRTGIFNLADVSIMIGMAILLWSWRNEKSLSSN